MMPMTTSSSISVNARLRRLITAPDLEPMRNARQSDRLKYQLNYHSIDYGQAISGDKARLTGDFEHKSDGADLFKGVDLLDREAIERLGDRDRFGVPIGESGDHEGRPVVRPDRHVPVPRRGRLRRRR